MGVYGFFSTWLKFKKELLPVYFCAYEIEAESLGDKKDSSECTFLHLYIQENKLHHLHSYSLVRDLLESYLGSIRLHTCRCFKIISGMKRQLGWGFFNLLQKMDAGFLSV